MVIISKELRIKKAIRTLKSILSDLSEKEMKTVESLVERVAFMQITLEDLEADINQNGITEMFSQSPNSVYERQRPAVNAYNSLLANYNKSCKQLYDLLPKDKGADSKAGGDELLAFLNKR